ncbi:glutamate racemase [Reichenbachiella sp. MALMAid0571]|uniref:glutamate racemase n=1 Tax=Reichenbachiella sp. MALMAid0571 TaxID=3143939 RepID=UPI0032DE445A
MEASQPIGIFDSGTGGLTVAKAVSNLLPNEQIVYFGDTAHLPYGDKSTATIQAYAIKITDILLQQNCKVILIACNSASAAAYDLIKEYAGSKAKVINVIDPAVEHIIATNGMKKVGLIGTLQTVNSGAFDRKLKGKVREFGSLATPLLVPMIEEGFVRNSISRDVIDKYLSDETLKGIDSLILGCTHYPIIKDEISQYYDGSVDIIDSAETVALSLKNYLEESNLMNLSTPNRNRFLVSDITKGFENAANLFFGEEIKLEKYPLWE